MRGLRVGSIVLGCVLCVGAVVGVVGGGRLAEAQLDQSLTARSLETAKTMEEFFKRARALDLMIAHSPTLEERLRERIGDRPAGRAAPGTADTSVAGNDHAIEDLLTYLERLYPGQIGEADVIDQDGEEVVRVVRGNAATHGSLKDDEAEKNFFRPALEMTPGHVYQSRPFVSDDTDAWVISNATRIPTGAPSSPALANFELTVDSFRVQAERGRGSLEVMVVNQDTGRIIFETGHPQPIGAPLGRVATDLTRRAAALGEPSGVISVGGRRAAIQAVHTRRGNQNHWLVVASAPDASAPWSSGPAKGSIAAAIAALVQLGSSIMGIRANQRELRQRASTDALTGLANRSVLYGRLADALARRRGHSTAVLMLLDLNGFKEVNDTLGHHHGDVLLTEVGQRISSSLRTTDLAARLGGDEFGLLIENIEHGSTDIEAVVSRVLSVIRRPYLLDGVGVHVDASVGIAILHEHGDTPELLLQRADVAMYQAKNSGAGHVIYDPETDPHSARRLSLTAGLLEAIEQRQITLHYQAKHDVRTRSVVGAEALIRWTHPTLGPLYPAEFIPVAEKTGLIRLLTEAVLDQALAQCREWLDQGRHIPVAVNCSAVDLVDDRLVQQVADRLVAHDVPASMLQLEITESAIMLDPARATEVLNRLHHMGVGLAIDDYGSGYTSLTYLKQLPVSELKIDKEFVSGVTLGGADAMIVTSTIELGHSLGMRVVAEGVENQHVLNYLRNANCDIVQGYHLCRPAPADEFTKCLDDNPDLSYPDKAPEDVTP